LEPAGSVELHDQGLGALALRAIERGDEQADGHRGDGRVHLDGGDRRRGAGGRGGREERGEAQQDDERAEQRPTDRRSHGVILAPARAFPLLLYRPRATTESSSKSRFAAGTPVMAPGPSEGGETSTMSPAASSSPRRPRTRPRASYEVRPPASGVPVPGAYAGSAASTSNEQKTGPPASRRRPSATGPTPPSFTSSIRITSKPCSRWKSKSSGP